MTSLLQLIGTPAYNEAWSPVYITQPLSDDHGLHDLYVTSKPVML